MISSSCHRVDLVYLVWPCYTDFQEWTVKLAIEMGRHLNCNDMYQVIYFRNWHYISDKRESSKASQHWKETCQIGQSAVHILMARHRCTIVWNIRSWVFTLIKLLGETVEWIIFDIQICLFHDWCHMSKNARMSNEMAIFSSAMSANLSPAPAF